MSIFEKFRRGTTRMTKITALWMRDFVAIFIQSQLCGPTTPRHSTHPCFPPALSIPSLTDTLIHSVNQSVQPAQFSQPSSVQFSSVQFSSVQFSSVQFSSVQFSQPSLAQPSPASSTSPVRSVQSSSVQFSSASSVQFSSVQFSLVQLVQPV